MSRPGSGGKLSARRLEPLGAGVNARAEHSGDLPNEQENTIRQRPPPHKRLQFTDIPSEIEGTNEHHSKVLAESNLQTHAAAPLQLISQSSYSELGDHEETDDLNARLISVRQWVEQFKAERAMFGSLIVFCEMQLREVLSKSANQQVPNELQTAAACCVLDEVCSGTPSLRGILTTIRAILYPAIFDGWNAWATYAHAAAARQGAVLTSQDGVSSLIPYFAKAETLDRVCQDLQTQRRALQNRIRSMSTGVKAMGPIVARSLDKWRSTAIWVIFNTWRHISVLWRQNRMYVQVVITNRGKNAQREAVYRSFQAWHIGAMQQIHQKDVEKMEAAAKDEDRVASRIASIKQSETFQSLEKVKIIIETQLNDLVSDFKQYRKDAEYNEQKLNSRIQELESELETEQKATQIAFAPPPTLADAVNAAADSLESSMVHISASGSTTQRGPGNSGSPVLSANATPASTPGVKARPAADSSPNMVSRPTSTATVPGLPLPPSATATPDAKSKDGSNTVTVLGKVKKAGLGLGTSLSQALAQESTVARLNFWSTESELQQLLHLDPGQQLLRWVNFHCAKEAIGSLRYIATPATNWDADFCDSMRLLVLLSRVQEFNLDLESLVLLSPSERASEVVMLFSKCDFTAPLVASNILQGNGLLIQLTLGEMFCRHLPFLDPVARAAAAVESARGNNARSKQTARNNLAKVAQDKQNRKVSLLLTVLLKQNRAHCGYLSRQAAMLSKHIMKQEEPVLATGNIDIKNISSLLRIMEDSQRLFGVKDAVMSTFDSVEASHAQMQSLLFSFQNDLMAAWKQFSCVIQPSMHNKNLWPTARDDSVMGGERHLTPFGLLGLATRCKTLNKIASPYLLENVMFGCFDVPAVGIEEFTRCLVVLSTIAFLSAQSGESMDRSQQKSSEAGQFAEMPCQLSQAVNRFVVLDLIPRISEKSNTQSGNTTHFSTLQMSADIQLTLESRIGLLWQLFVDDCPFPKISTNTLKNAPDTVSQSVITQDSAVKQAVQALGEMAPFAMPFHSKVMMSSNSIPVPENGNSAAESKTAAVENAEPDTADPSQDGQLTHGSSASIGGWAVAKPCLRMLSLCSFLKSHGFDCVKQRSVEKALLSCIKQACQLPETPNGPASGKEQAIPVCFTTFLQIILWSTPIIDPNFFEPLEVRLQHVLDTLLQGVEYPLELQPSYGQHSGAEMPESSQNDGELLVEEPKDPK